VSLRLVPSKLDELLFALYPLQELALDELEFVRDVGPHSSLTVDFVLAIMGEHLLDLIAAEAVVFRVYEEEREGGREVSSAASISPLSLTDE
jgi:hypothetical protein